VLKDAIREDLRWQVGHDQRGENTLLVEGETYPSPSRGHHGDGNIGVRWEISDRSVQGLSSETTGHTLRAGHVPRVIIFGDFQFLFVLPRT
jgi:hypothetical protein